MTDRAKLEAAALLKAIDDALNFPGGARKPTYEIVRKAEALRAALKAEPVSIEAPDSERRCLVPWCVAKVKSNNFCWRHMNGLDPAVEE